MAGDRQSTWLSWLPLLTALAAAEAIDRVASTHTAVKWPNDLLIGEQKVGGILCESGTSQQSGPFQVVGIGLNVNGRVQDFPEEIRQIATTVSHETGHDIDRNRLLATFLDELETCIEEYSARGTERIAQAYRQRCTTIGKRVKASLAEGLEIIGLAEGIGQDGSLTIALPPQAQGKQKPEILHLRVADIVHVRT